MAILSVSHLTKEYPVRGDKTRTFKAVDDVSLSVEPGTTLGIIGESGSGKSTLGKLALDLIPATAGRVEFDGRELFDVAAKRRLKGAELRALRPGMQMIFQDPYASLNPKQTIGQIVATGVKYHRIVEKRDVEAYVIDVMERCGLPASAYTRYPFEFSGGQRQRAVIARALAVKPKFIVCDEPTASLDVSIQSQILNLMLDLKQSEGLSYLFISHDFSVVRAFCDSVCVMYKGRVVEEGPCDEVVARPKDDYTKLLLSSIPIEHPNQRRGRAVPVKE